MTANSWNAVKVENIQKLWVKSILVSIECQTKSDVTGVEPHSDVTGIELQSEVTRVEPRSDIRYLAAELPVACAVTPDNLQD